MTFSGHPANGNGFLNERFIMCVCVGGWEGVCMCMFIYVIVCKYLLMRYNMLKKNKIVVFHLPKHKSNDNQLKLNINAKCFKDIEIELSQFYFSISQCQFVNDISTKQILPRVS